MKYSYYRALHLFLVCFFVITTSYARLSDIKYRHIDVHNGLPSDVITAIVKDSLGYIWIGTKNGVCRYDGSKFILYNNDGNDSNSLKGNEVTSLLITKHNQLWIATNNGICRYDYRTNKFYPLHIPDNYQQKNNSITKLFIQDREGYIWFQEYSSWPLLGYNPEKKTYKKLDFFVPDKSDAVYSMYEDVTGDLWISRLYYFYHYHTKTKTFEQIRNPRRACDPADPFIITGFSQTDSATLWMTSWGGGLEHFNIATGNTTHYLPEWKEKLNGTANIIDYPRWIKDRQSSNYMLWMVSEYGMVNFDTTSKEFRIFKPDIYNPYSNKITFTVSNFSGNFYDASQSMLWCWGPYGIDVCDFNQQTVQTFHTISEKEKISTGSANGFVNNLANNNEYYLGNFITNGIYIYDDERKTIKQRLLPFIGNGITSLFQPDKYKLWIASATDIWEWNKQTNAVKKISNLIGKTTDELACNKEVETWLKDSRGIIWIGTNGGGICRYDPATDKYQWRNRVMQKGTTSLPAPTVINTFVESKDGSIYALDNTKGIFRIAEDGVIADLFMPDSFTNAIGHHKILPTRYQSMAIDKQDVLWICTDEGLISFNTKSATFSMNAAMANIAGKRLQSVAIDKTGYLWLTGTNTLLVFDPNTGRCRSFDYKSGFENSPDGCHLLINNNGDIRIAYADHIESINGDPFDYGTYKMPVVQMTHMYSGDSAINPFDSVGQQNDIHISYRNNNLTLEYALPLYHNADDIVYYYMLDGFDKTFVNAGHAHTAKYTNLPGGDYTFMVKAFDPASGCYSAVSYVKVIVHPPFWKTWWFTTIFILFLVTLIYLVYKYRLEQMLRLERMRTAISSDLHDEIGATLSSISIYSNVAKRTAEIDKDKSREYLDKIETSSREMIDSMSDIVWSINPANDSMDKMLQRMRSYAYEIGGAAGMLIHWKENELLKKQKLSMEQRKNLYLFFKEGINNAAKYAKAKDIHIVFELSAHSIALSIQDNGVGFNKEQSTTGNGLQNMTLRSKALKGDFRLTTSTHAGTLLQLTFPV